MKPGFSALNPFDRIPVAVLLLTLLSGILLLTNLGDGYLWQDEAETALVSKSVLTHGVPKGHDDRNSFSQNDGRDIGENGLWTWHPWLPFYVTAASFAIFDTSTFSARLPHALAGIGSVLLMYFLTLQFFHNRKVAFITALFLLFCVGFLLLSTEVRYYSLSIFFTISGLWGFLRMIEQKKYGTILFVTSAILLIHTHYLYSFTLLISVLTYALLFEKQHFRKVLTASGIVVIVNIPALLWYGQIGSVYERDYLDTEIISAFFGVYISYIHSHIFNGLLFLFLLVLTAAGWRKSKNSAATTDHPDPKRLLLPGFFIVSTLAALALFAEYQYFRYLGPIIPMLFIVIGYCMFYVIKVHALLIVAVFAVWLYTGDMNRYIEKLTHEYRGPMEGIVGTLNALAKPGDTVAIPYGDLPVKFYTNDLYIIGAHDGKDYTSTSKAQWIILRHTHVTEQAFEMNTYLYENFDRSRYQVADIDFPDAPYQNRESPALHYFTSPINFPNVQIFRRINEH